MSCPLPISLKIPARNSKMFSVCFASQYGGERLLQRVSPAPRGAACRSKRRRISFAATSMEAQSPHHIEDGKTSDADLRIHMHSDESASNVEPPSSEKNVPPEQTLNELKDTGVKDIENLGDEVKDDLGSVSRHTEEFATEIVNEEIQRVLDKYGETQRELIGQRKADTAIIRQESKRLEELVKSLQTDRGPRLTSGPNAAALVSGVLVIAAIYYAWGGFVEGSAEYLRNATVDALAAAFVAFLSNWRSGAGSERKK